MAKAKKNERRVQYTSAKETAEALIAGSESGAIRRPEGMDFFNPKKAGTYKLDFLPYIVKKGKNEKGGNPNAKAGNAHFERSYATHRGIGIANKSYCCLARCFGKKCPICEDRSKMMRDSDADPDLVKSLEPKDRQLFLVSERGNEKAGVMLWEVSYHNFGKQLVRAINSADDDEQEVYTNFYHLDGGSTLKVVMAEESMGTTKFLKASNIEFKPRKEALDEDLLDKVPDLDSLLIELGYDKLKAIYMQEDEDEDEDDKPAKRGGKGASKAKDEDEEEDDDTDDEEDEDEEEEEEDEKPAKKGGKAPKFKVGMTVEYEDEEMTVAKVSPDGSSLTLKDEDGKQHKAIDPDECVIVENDDEEEEEEEDEKPAKKGGKKATDEDDDDEEEDEDADDEDEDEDEEEDEKPAPKKRGPGRPRKAK